MNKILLALLEEHYTKFGCASGKVGGRSLGEAKRNRLEQVHPGSTCALKSQRTGKTYYYTKPEHKQVVSTKEKISRAEERHASAKEGSKAKSWHAKTLQTHRDKLQRLLKTQRTESSPKNQETQRAESPKVKTPKEIQQNKIAGKWARENLIEPDIPRAEDEFDIKEGGYASKEDYNKRMSELPEKRQKLRKLQADLDFKKYEKDMGGEWKESPKEEAQRAKEYAEKEGFPREQLRDMYEKIRARYKQEVRRKYEIEIPKLLEQIRMRYGVKKAL